LEKKYDPLQWNSAFYGWERTLWPSWRDIHERDYHTKEMGREPEGLPQEMSRAVTKREEGVQENRPETECYKIPGFPEGIVGAGGGAAVAMGGKNGKREQFIWGGPGYRLNRLTKARGGRREQVGRSREKGAQGRKKIHERRATGNLGEEESQGISLISSRVSKDRAVTLGDPGLRSREGNLPRSVASRRGTFETSGEKREKISNSFREEGGP